MALQLPEHLVIYQLQLHLLYLLAEPLPEYSIPASVANLANLTINNANGVTMNSNITLAAAGVLTLTSGIVQAGTYTLKITNTNPAAAIVWTPGSFVNVTTGYCGENTNSKSGWSR